MPRLITMANLVSRAQKRCDMENNGLIDQSVGGEWYSIASSAFGELYMLIAESGMRYYETATRFTPSGATIAQPSDLLASIGLDWIVNTTTGERRELRELMVQERAQYAAARSGDSVAYSLAATTFTIWPDPTGTNRTFELIYIPQPADLATLGASSTVDVVTADGEEFVIWAMAVKAIAKQEADPQLAISERERFRAQVLEWATLRAFNNPRRRQVREDGGYGMGWDSSDWGWDAADWRYR